MNEFLPASFLVERFASSKRQVIDDLIAVHRRNYANSGAALIIGEGRFVAPKKSRCARRTTPFDVLPVTAFLSRSARVRRCRLAFFQHDSRGADRPALSHRDAAMPSSTADTIERHAANALREVAKSADPERTIELSTGVSPGAAAQSIGRAARDYDADLIVVGARGERDANGEPALGGTSAKLLATAQVPLLLVRRSRKDSRTGVVVALDLSPRSLAVLKSADLAAADQHLHAYHVYDMPFAARLEAYGLAAGAIDVYSEQAQAQRQGALGALVASIARSGVTTCVVERGDPGVLLGRFVESVRPSLVVVGKHVKATRSTPASSVGSVARHMANSVAADVLVV